MTLLDLDWKNVPTRAEAQKLIPSMFTRGGLDASFTIRGAFIRSHSFAIPCSEALYAIRKYTGIMGLLEVGAGTGFWARLIADAKTDVVAFDGLKGDYGQGIGKFFPVGRCSARAAVRRYPERDVLMVWPCYSKRWAREVAQALAPGRTLFYVGEHGGCTADDAFHKLVTNEAMFERVATVDIPQFDGLHDGLYIYRKRR